MQNVVNEKHLSFSLKYNGISLSELLPDVKADSASKKENGIAVYDTVYTLEDGLEIVRSVKVYEEFNAFEQVLYFNNKSRSNSGIISELHDYDGDFDFPYDAPPKARGYRISETTAKIYNPTGSNWVRNEFCSKEQFILPGEKYRYTPTGGRSSQGKAPFFDINRGHMGVILAIGWSGQWEAVFSRTDKSINVKTGIEGVRFKLLPGESIRTSSIVIMTYQNGQNRGHNSFRRLIKEHFSLIGKPGRPENGPFCTSSWGAVPSNKMVERVERIAKENFGFEYYWIDAAWYGTNDGYCPNEYEGDWATQTGNWQVNTKTHPDKLLDVSKAIKKSGMKFLLWIEPERVIATSSVAKEHPDWFFKIPGETSPLQNWLLNLGDRTALDATIGMVSAFISELGLDCYRQDFNIDPLDFWRKNDLPDREGINEIKHIMGLYEFWDTLLERFPNLLIDNCASGGRRIDIETLRRSIPLWRSDYQCTWDADPETAQTHNSGISWWIPYSGTGTGGVIGDTYRIRSCYSSAMVTSYWMYENWDITDDQPLEWVRKSNTEYKKARKYFTCDYYSLVKEPMDDSNWAAWQFNDPVDCEGIVMAFRRPLSPCETSCFELGGLNMGRLYRFEDADTGEITEILSDELIIEGFRVTIPEKRSSKLYFYSFGSGQMSSDCHR